MKINLVFDYGADVVNVPYFVGAEIKEYRERFDKWCYDKDNVETYNKETGVFCFDGKTFADWLNKYELHDPVKATLLEENVSDYDRSLPTLFF